ncbi:unnamed protein product [Vitrella brassicaformis CCMP3155]|uniref:GB1/RHD3-type G domain-containing protein n=2 Tax=Vitrella brassicaformis TaxID=1169539 RepID=A0A0G4EEA4_VITBC|nr:unnamed protein product [Vitrella brassicaformis CCMP3155]|mmetsp:Transcript_34031/g.84135  ORF Transcript_34031/g.84135 Transcript_34031/m.84135 type:complete len:741 (+) Transcript_34031:147-2369(+)|eukprot:CEL93884.1 unnamed protein product [Vitrella brassicaformis CCMP3155]
MAFSPSSWFRGWGFGASEAAPVATRTTLDPPSQMPQAYSRTTTGGYAYGATANTQTTASPYTQAAYSGGAAYSGASGAVSVSIPQRGGSSWRPPKNTKTQRQPLRLIDVVKRGSKEVFEIGEEALRHLEGLGGKKVGIISVCGLYRTGKSYLLNLFMDTVGESGSAFRVGDTVHACTDGIWMWGALEDEDCVYILLDCEGTGDTRKDKQHDARLFSLAVLVSTYFIYNSKGIIDEQAIQGLSMITQLVQHLRKQMGDKGGAGLGGGGPMWTPPIFLWVLRDFILELRDQQDNPISATQYLEMALADKTFAAFKREDTRKVRECLVDFFRERDCMTLVQPLIEEDQLQNLHKIPFSQLRPEFRQQVTAIRQKVFTETHKKAVQGLPLNGKSFARLLKAYVEAINAGGIPPVVSTWNAIQHDECSKLCERLGQQFVQRLDEAVQGRTPMPESEIEAIVSRLRAEVQETFKRDALGEDHVVASYANELDQTIQHALRRTNAANEDGARRQVHEWLEASFQQVWQTVSSKQFSSMEDLSHQIDEAKRRYAGIAKGPQQVLDEALREYLERVVRGAQRCLEDAQREKEREEILQKERERAEAEARAAADADYRRQQERLREAETAAAERQGKVDEYIQQLEKQTQEKERVEAELQQKIEAQAQERQQTEATVQVLAQQVEMMRQEMQKQAEDRERERREEQERRRKKKQDKKNKQQPPKQRRGLCSCTRPPPEKDEDEDADEDSP